MLRERIGHDNFRKGIQSYYKKYMNANATTDNFIEEMEKASNQNLKPFFKQWLNRPDILKIDRRTGHTIQNPNRSSLHLKQVQASDFVFDAPVEFQVYEAGNKTPLSASSTSMQKATSLTFPLSSKPAMVLFDPRVVLLADVTFNEK